MCQNKNFDTQVGKMKRSRNDGYDDDGDSQNRSPNKGEASPKVSVDSIAAKTRRRLGRIVYPDNRRVQQPAQVDPLVQQQNPPPPILDGYHQNMLGRQQVEQQEAMEQFNLSELLILDDEVDVPNGVSLDNQPILAHLSRNGNFLYVRPNAHYVNGRTTFWANMPSHVKYFLQPTENIFHKIMPDINGIRSMVGSTVVSAIYRRNNAEVIPLQIVSVNSIKSYEDLLVRQQKIQAINMPGLGKLCLVIRFSNEGQKDVFIKGLADHLNKPNVQADNYPTLVLCYKHQRSWKITREYSPQEIIALQQRRGQFFVAVNLNPYIELYEKELRRYGLCLNSLQESFGENADLNILQAQDQTHQGLFSAFSLEQVELFKRYVVYHIQILGGILAKMRRELSEEQRNIPACVRLMQNISQQLQGARETQASLQRLSQNYRDYLYSVDNLMGNCGFQLHPGSNSGDVEEQLRRALESFLTGLGCDIDINAQFNTTREFFAWILDHNLLPGNFDIQNLHSKYQCAQEWARNIEASFREEFQPNLINAF